MSEPGRVYELRSGEQMQQACGKCGYIGQPHLGVCPDCLQRFLVETLGKMDTPVAVSYTNGVRYVRRLDERDRHYSDEATVRRLLGDPK